MVTDYFMGTMDNAHFQGSVDGSCQACQVFSGFGKAVLSPDHMFSACLLEMNTHTHMLQQMLLGFIQFTFNTTNETNVSLQQYKH